MPSISHTVECLITHIKESKKKDLLILQHLFLDGKTYNESPHSIGKVVACTHQIFRSCEPRHLGKITNSIENKMTRLPKTC